VPANLNLAVPVVINQVETGIANVATHIIALDRTGQITREVIPVLHAEFVAILEDDDSRASGEKSYLVLHLGGTVDTVAQRLEVQLPPSEGGGSSRGDVVLIEDASYLQLASVLVKNRQELRQPGAQIATPTTYDAKEADTKSPPIGLLAPPAGPNVLLPLIDDVCFSGSFLTPHIVGGP
jgi:hypothetical protein